MKTFRALLKAAVAALVVTLLFGSLSASPSSASSTRAAFPTHIDLPDGFRPEGIAIKGKSFYVGSLADGAIYKGDLRTGDGAVIGGGAAGSVSVGLAVDRGGRIFAAGGPTGNARVIDGETGAVIKTYHFTDEATFVNDVVIARGSAWFTDSVRPFLYRVPLDLGQAESIPLTGDLVYTTGFNVNGIDASADGKKLVLVQSNTGSLFTATPGGETTRIDLGSKSVPNGDGVLLEGRTLFVVQNQLNLIAVIRLDRKLTSGTVVDEIESSDFDVPTTIDRFGHRLYAVNARFGTPPTPDTSYWITAVPASRKPHGHD